MLLALDPRSLIAIAGVMAALMAVVLAFMRRHYPAHIKGLGYWAAAPTLWLASTILYSGRDTAMPTLLSVVGANTILMIGSTCYYMGCRTFFGHASTWRTWGLYLLLAVLLQTGVDIVGRNYQIRLVVFTALALAIYGANLRFMLRHGGRRLPSIMVQIVLAVHLLILVTRLATASFGMVGASMMEGNLLQTLYIASYVLTVLMLSIAAVLMATDGLVTELEHLATHDPLTRSINRRALLQRASDELARSQRSGRGPALAMLDLDHFKKLNDTHGHQHGDAVLVHFAQTTQALLRRADRLGRYGGEEFVLLLPETALPEAQMVTQRIHGALASGHALDCQLSIGLTTWKGPCDTLDAMLARADKALYQAKAQGRNQTCVA
ncbi:GGDEF domain-containing protein [Acidovorax sp. HDW3]|uniref:GGDEF domain-containing protein n=1 Tax=Acidovorax sp. HDW3 TaxID=2714923 RepID=UPI001F0E9FCD|nr:GGDEF domain-containing protein [Acidovorax sp. HDW3]